MIQCSTNTPALYIAEATKKANHRTLYGLMKKWQELAHERLQRLKEQNVKQKATDCCDVIRAILRDLQTGVKIFFTYDDKLQVEGIALVKLTKAAVEIKQLASHPKNIPLFPGEPRGCKGVGTALLTLVASLAQENKLRTIKLESVPSAVEFYKHFGFQVCANQAPGITSLTTMKLETVGISILVEKHGPKLVRATKEPDLIQATESKACTAAPMTPASPESSESTT